MTPEQLQLARELVAHPEWTWTAPWCLAPDDLGRVYRRNWSPGDPGFGFTQVAGRAYRGGRDTSQALPDIRDDANGGVLLGMLGGCSVHHGRGGSWEVNGKRGDTLAEAAARAWLGVRG